MCKGLNVLCLGTIDETDLRCCSPWVDLRELGGIELDCRPGVDGLDLRARGLVENIPRGTAAETQDEVEHG